MSKKSKKTAVAILTVVLVMLFTACGSGSKESGEDKGDNTGSTENKDTLTVAMELAYPPFETKDKNGEPSGISVDFIKDFGKYVGKDIKIENTAWDGLIPSLQSGKADLVISSMTINDERKKQVDFSDPYANAYLAVLTNKDADVKKVGDLNKKGMKVAVKTGSTGAYYADKNLSKAEITKLADESACVTEVAQGKANGFIYDQLTIYRNWQKNKDTTKAVLIPFQDAENWGVAVKKGNTQLKDQLNKFIQKYKKEGGFDKLTKKYSPDEKAAFDKMGFRWFFDFGKDKK